MSDVKQRKQRKRKEPRDEQTPAPKDEPTKEEYKIARWMRSNIPTKKTKFLSHTVEYFTACKAIDQLLDSPWAKSSKTGEDPLFTTRESIVEYMDVMLRHKIFHRARKIIVPESELKSKKKKDKEKDNNKDEKPAVVEESKKDEDKEKNRKDEAAITAAESSQAEGGDQSSSKVEKKKQKKEEGEKKKRKIRLDMHLDQRFVDGIDAYVWIYEPTPYYYYVIGFLVVIAVIAVCLFPLWPSSVRQGVYYLSLAAAGFLVFILALAVLRLVFFCLIWGLTFGRHHVWLLPNLTEDVGFFASFWPLYKYEYKSGGGGGGEEEEKNNKNSSESSALNSSEQQQQQQNNQEGDGEGKEDKDKKAGGDSDNSETESEGSQRSQTGKDFEVLDKKELESYNLTS